ncbi:MAG: agmatine deiminase family protein [Thiotrichaceae bacterium]
MLTIQRCGYGYRAQPSSSMARKLAGVDWQFNAWAENQESIQDYQQDVLLASTMLTQRHLPCFSAPLVLEGGAIYADGEGHC